MTRFLPIMRRLRYAEYNYNQSLTIHEVLTALARTRPQSCAISTLRGNEFRPTSIGNALLREKSLGNVAKYMPKRPCPEAFPLLCYVGASSRYKSITTSTQFRSMKLNTRKLTNTTTILDGQDISKKNTSDAFKSTANKRSYVVGSVYGCAAAIALCAYPDSFQQFILSADPTMPTIAAAIVGTAGVASGFVHRTLVSSPGDTGRISPMQGMFIGGMTMLGVHIVVPSAVLAIPALLDYGTMCADPVQWLQALPLDVLAYGWSLTWWSLVSFYCFVFISSWLG